MKKYLKVMLVLVVALSMLCTFAFAADADSNPFNDYADGSTSASKVNTAVNKVGGTIISVVQTVGYIIAVVMVLMVGIQYLLGTPAKKQELKSRLISIIIGAALIVAGVTVLGVVGEVIKDTETALKTSSVEASKLA